MTWVWHQMFSLSPWDRSTGAGQTILTTPGTMGLLINTEGRVWEISTSVLKSVWAQNLKSICCQSKRLKHGKFREFSYFQQVFICIAHKISRNTSTFFFFFAICCDFTLEWILNKIYEVCCDGHSAQELWNSHWRSLLCLWTESLPASQDGFSFLIDAFVRFLKLNGLKIPGLFSTLL